MSMYEVRLLLGIQEERSKVLSEVQELYMEDTNEEDIRMDTISAAKVSSIHF